MIHRRSTKSLVTPRPSQPPDAGNRPGQPLQRCQMRGTGWHFADIMNSTTTRVSRPLFQDQLAIILGLYSGRSGRWARDLDNNVVAPCDVAVRHAHHQLHLCQCVSGSGPSALLIVVGDLIDRLRLSRRSRRSSSIVLDRCWSDRAASVRFCSKGRATLICRIEIFRCRHTLRISMRQASLMSRTRDQSGRIGMSSIWPSCAKTTSRGRWCP